MYASDKVEFKDGVKVDKSPFTKVIEVSYILLTPIRKR
jgi:hypothetical protein